MLSLNSICNDLSKDVPGKEEIAKIISKEFSLITEFAIVSILTDELFYTLNEQVIYNNDAALLRYNKCFANCCIC